MIQLKRKQRAPSSVLGLSLDGSRLEGVVLRRGPVAVDKKPRKLRPIGQIVGVTVLGPRFGIVGRLTDKTVVRTGYALVWIEQAGITTPFTTPNFPFLQDVSLRTLDNIAPAFVLAKGPTVTPVSPTPTAGLGQGVEGLRVGIPAEYFIEGLDPEVEAAVRAAIEILKGLGAKTESVSLPHTEYGLAAYYVIGPAEASSNLARYDGVKYGLRVPGARDLIDMYSRTRGAGFGAEVKRRVMLGTYALSAGYYDAYYGKAQKVRTLVQRDFQKAFERVDVIVAPTTPTAAFKTGEKEDPLSMYLNDVFTIPVNLAGLPGVSVPAGFTKAGLPVGLQVIGKAFDEAAVLRTAKAYESATEWRKRKPPLETTSG